MKGYSSNIIFFIMPDKSMETMLDILNIKHYHNQVGKEAHALLDCSFNKT